MLTLTQRKSIMYHFHANDVKDGYFDELFLSIEYLERKYNGKP